MLVVVKIFEQDQLTLEAHGAPSLKSCRITWINTHLVLPVNANKLLCICVSNLLFNNVMEKMPRILDTGLFTSW